MPVSHPSLSQGPSPPSHSLLAALTQSLCSSCHTLRRRRVCHPCALSPCPLFLCSLCLGGILYIPLLGFPSSAKRVWQPPAPVCCQVLPALTSTIFPAAEPCRLPLDEGDCQRYTLRWYYNQRVTECRPFVYSGCRGNLNRFDSKEECELHCGQRFVKVMLAAVVTAPASPQPQG
uniref:BPTI/Kunitz inhibitor domain-containing protein n=1 Tax=Malurus cyaneus samueli TaxID=2593467 RepID=A0A8C5TN41_9PASS